MGKINVGLVIFFLIVLCLIDALAESGYDSFGERDPFVPLAGINLQDSRTIGNSGITVESIKLQGIVINPDGTHSALINGEVVKDKTALGDIFVEEIRDNTVTLIVQEKRYVLKLY